MKAYNLFSLSLLLLSVFFWSCSGKTSGSKSDSVATDTAAVTAVKDSVEPEPVAELMVTPDLSLLEVKGNVKEIKGKVAGDYVYGGSARFDKDGKLTHYGNSEPIDRLSNIKRDDKNRLTYFLASAWTTVKWEGDKLLSVAEQMNEFTDTETYKYDSKGLVTEISCHSVDEAEGYDETVVAKVSYPADAFDSNGNWIKRVVKYPDHTETQIREITYY